MLKDPEKRMLVFGAQIKELEKRQEWPGESWDRTQTRKITKGNCSIER